MTKRFFCIIWFLFFAVAVNAQDPPPDGDGTCDDCPIDGGISLLLAAGIVIGMKRQAMLRKHDA